MNFIIIDNRQGLRTIAIECRKKAFNTTEQVSKILENNLTHAIFHEHCYSLSIIPDFYPEDLFEAWTSLQQHVNAIRFGTPEMSEEEFAEKLKLFKQKNKDYFDDSLMTSILQMAYEAISGWLFSNHPKTTHTHSHIDTHTSLPTQYSPPREAPPPYLSTFLS